MESTIFTLLIKTLEEQLAAIQENLAAGGAGSFEQYCHTCGRYAALRDTLDEVKELEKRFIAE